jgi:hypothetical protein
VIFGVRTSGAWRLPKNLINEITALFETFQATDSLLTETEIIEIIEDRYTYEISSHQIYDLRFLLSVYGFNPLPNKLAGFGRDFVPGWIVVENLNTQVLYQTAKSVHRIVSSSVEPISSFDLMIQLNRRKKKKVDKHYVHLAEKILIDIEKLDEERYQLKFEFLSSLADQAYRLLFEQNKPLHLREMQREINHRQVKKGLPTDASIRNLGNQLAADSRFMSIGRSGIWSLAKWENVHHKTIVELMEEFFHVHQTAASPGEIYEFVSRRRSDVSKRSVYAYLSMHKSFVKIGRKLYELSAWGSKPQTNSKRRTKADIEAALIPAVKKIFDEAAVQSIPFHSLIQTLNEETSIQYRIPPQLDKSWIRGQATRFLKCGGKEWVMLTDWKK